MSIWKNPLHLEELNKEGPHRHMSHHVGITFVEVGDDYLCATMTVDERTKQPYGILHGGASCVLAETVGSVAANYCLDFATSYAVGMSISANHLRPVSKGKVTARASALHLGKTTQLWEIKIRDEEGRLVCDSRLTMAVVPRKSSDQ